MSLCQIHLSVLATSLIVGLCASGAQADGDPARGETLFRPCVACHMIGEGAVNRIGPHLNGLVGRRIGSNDGYDYSDPLVEAAAEEDIWSPEALNRQFRSKEKQKFLFCM